MTLDAANPVANPESIVTLGKARFTVMTSRMIRMEWAADGKFEDRPSLAVINRRLPKVDFRAQTKGNKLTLRTGDVTVEYSDTGRPFSARNLSASFRMNGRTVEWRYGLRDKQNLRGTVRTLDCAHGDKFFPFGNPTGPGRPVDLGQGLVSRSGWAVVDDSENIVLDDHPGASCPWVTGRHEGRRQDLYLLAYGQDYRQALGEGAQVFGQQPLPPRYTLGYWYSRYWAYTDKEIEELVGQFERMKLPLDVMVIDMDWHTMGWTGYTWDRSYFPDPAEFLRWLKDRDLKITLNLHPASGVARHEEQFGEMCKAMGQCPKETHCVEFDITDPRYVSAYFKLLHHPHEQLGVDFWWMDWQQGNTTKLPGLDALPWINQLHWEDMQRNPRRQGQRPLCFSRYGGLGAGRYPVGFSGDTFSTWESLAYQPYFTATAANVLYGYWSHDIGGHQPGPVDPELYVRWVQFGACSPVLRTHSSKVAEAERRLWQFGDPYGRIMIDTIRWRYEMVPYLYSENRRCCDSGVSMLHPMYYDWPKEQEAYSCDKQYMLGDSLLAAPVVQAVDPTDEMAEVSVWLPKGQWFDLALGQMVRGGSGLQKRRYLLDEVPLFARPGTVIPGQRVPDRLHPGSYKDLVMTIVPGAEGSYDLYEDDGVSLGYLGGESAVIRMSHKATATGRTVSIGKARGGFAGFAEQRTLEVRLPASAPPKAVKVGGRALQWQYRLDESGEGWTYDGQTGTTIIRLAQVDVAKGLTINIVADKSRPQRLANGLAGLMRRLERICQYNNLASPAFAVHPDERMAVEVAQTGNRIGRAPENFAAELRGMRRMLKKLPKALAEFQQALVEKKRDKPAEYVQQARNILKSTLAEL